MPHPAPPEPSLFRDRGEPTTAKVSMVELFFDLVFVFAVTQLSHLLLVTPTLLGAVHALMLLGLVVSSSITSAFAAGAWAFALGYVLMHALRSGFVLWAARTQPRHRRRNFQRNLFWVALTALPWFAGAAAAPGQRLYWWLGAIGAEFISPWLLYWTPGLGASRTSGWAIDGAHMAERCALFVIIALGESLLITGASFAGAPASAAAAAAFATAFFGSVAMWWIYFHAGAEHAAQRIATASDPGRTARIAYSYLHIAIVAGIIVSAVGDEMVLAHPEHADAAAVLALVGGPALFLLGCMLFKWVSYERRTPPLSHAAGLLALIALLAVGQAHWLSAVQLAGLSSAVLLLLVAGWETLVLRRR